LCATLSVTAQRNAGVPFFTNFAPNKYRQGPQNFAVVQDSTGILYFGNNNGVLIFDGVEWSLVPVKNKSEVHSLAIDQHGKIFVGAQGEFGFLERQSTGQWAYQSLVHLLAEQYRNFNDVWSIYPIADRVVFRSTAGIYIYQNNQIKTIQLANSSHRSFCVNDNVFVRLNHFGLQQLEGDVLVTVPGGEKFLYEPVHSMFAYSGNRYLVVSENQGIFLYDGKSFTPFRTEADDLIKGQSIYGTMLPDSTYALGTRRNGLIIINRNGEVIHYVTKKHGLQDESVWAVCYDSFSGSLWLAQNNGISCVEISSPFTLFSDVSGAEGQVYHVIKQFNRIYSASSLGVFYKPWIEKESINPDDDPFKPVSALNTQAWFFYKDENSLLVTTNRGIFQIMPDNRVKNVGFEGRAWYFLALKKFPGHILVNTAEGIFILKKENDQFSILQKGIKTPVDLYAFSEDDDGTIWADNPVKGVYKIQFDNGIEHEPTFTLYNSAQGFPTDYRLRAFATRSAGFLFTSEKGMYRFNKETDRFQPDAELNSKIFNEKTRVIEWVDEDTLGFLWITLMDAGEQSVVLLRKDDRSDFIMETDVFNRIRDFKVRDFLTIDEKNILMGTSEGIVHYNFLKKPVNHLQLFLRKLIILQRDSTVLTNFQQTFPFSHKENSLQFHVGATGFSKENATAYQFYMEGFDSNWSPWSTTSIKEYTNLSEGNYQLKVRARNAYNHIQESTLLSFTVKPPWYRATGALVMYVLGAVGILVGVSYWRSRSMLAINRKLERLVSERTEEIQSQKEEIFAQKEYIEKKNVELESAREVIAQQYEKLKDVNVNLESKVAERTIELENAYANLLSLKSELDTFVYRASHDINGPVLRLLGLCHVALIDVDDEKAREYIQTLEAEAKVTTRMLQKLLTYYQLKSREPEWENVNLFELVNRITTAQKRSLSVADNVLDLQVPKDINLTTDSYLLSAALANVTENAFQFFKPFADAHQVKITATKKVNEIEISVSDTGMGVDQTLRDKIFNKFFRGTERSKGAGLGLFIASEALSKIHGSIRHEQHERTEFILSLSLR
jgi:signal transduction histidine kinase